jgi:hypothetical protein
MTANFELLQYIKHDNFSIQNCGESVNSIEGGVFGTNGFDELVATTYTGT